MDAHALLTSQGWRGKGHSLHPTSDTTGLSRPILVSQKRNTLGVGSKQHKTSDMWWMNAFDSSLKGLDTSTEGVVVQTVTSSGLDMVARGGGKYVGKSGLYACFVRGEMLGGTLTPESLDRDSDVASSRGDSAPREEEKKRKRKEEMEKDRKEAKRVKKASVVEEPKIGDDARVKKVEGETKEDRRTRRAAKKALRSPEPASIAVEGVAESQIETKEQRRERKRLKKLAKGQEEEKGPHSKDTDDEAVSPTVPETKEERRERKRLQKLALATPVESAEASSDGTPKKKKKKEKQRAK